MIAAQAIKSGDSEIVVAGGMESMSNIPYYVPKARSGHKFGHGKIMDGLVQDGLTDVYSGDVMGVCGELCAETMNITREEQDNFAIESYNRSKKAWENGSFANEVSPIEIPQRKGDPIIISEDEEFKNVKLDKIKKLRTVFKKEGTITAGNASTLNDGAAAIILMSEEKAKELGLKPIAKIISYADASQEPEWFTTSPAKAIPLALTKAKLSIEDIDYWELNEAFSVVGIANMKELKLKPENVNIYGGAVSLGHPLGCSGARIITTLLSVLINNDAKLGGAGICNGGGGASAMIIENSNMYGICLLTVIPMRKEKSDLSEMINQILFGESFKILKKDNNWSYVELLHDSYNGWICNKQYEPINEINKKSIVCNKMNCNIHLGEFNQPIVLGSLI